VADAPSNEADICNLALDLLNEGPISSIEDPIGKIPTLCARHYDQSRRAALRSHTWNFAMKRVSMAELTGNPVFEFDNWYELPSDYIRIVQIGANNQHTNYGIENGKLLVNSGGGELFMRYVYDFVNIQDMDPLFIDYWVAFLALKLAYPVTGSNTAVSRVSKILEGAMGYAQNVDGQERPPRRIERSRFKNARRRFGTYASQYIEEE